LDRGLYEEWLKVYAPEFVYWVPATADGGDPRRQVAVTFDDRRRTEDRIFRFRTGYAWSQAPPSRTVHLIGNVEVFKTAREGTMMVRIEFLDQRVLERRDAHAHRLKRPPLRRDRRGNG